MNNTNNSFSIFLNIVLGLLLIGSIIFSYFFGNFGGISIKELNDNYIVKGELVFQDLPENVQKKYMNRDTFSVKNSSNETIKKAFDDEGNPLVIEAEDAEDFNEIVKSLQERIVFLEKENIFLVNDKEELLKIVEHEKSKNNSDQKSLLSSNLEKINEAEQQHYENISTLTLKINDLQRENIRLAQQINGKNDLAKIKIDELEITLKEQQKRFLEDKNQALELEKSKYANLENEKISLQQQLDILRQKIESHKNDYVMLLGKKDQIIADLQNKINQLMLEKHNMLTKNSQSVLEMEKRNSIKLKEFDDIIKNNSAEKEAIKTGYLNKIAKIEDMYKKKIDEQNKKLENFAQKLDEYKQNSAEILRKNEVASSTKEKEYNNKISSYNKIVENLNITNKTLEEENKSLLKKIKEQETLVFQNQGQMSQLQDKINQYNKTVENLNIKIKTFEEENKSLFEENKKQKTLVTQGQDQILQLQDKINTLDKNDRNLDIEIDEKVKANEEKHNENYKILNEKIANMEKNLKSKESEQSKILAKLNNEKAELIKEINIANKENDEKYKYITTLKDNIVQMSKEKENLKLSENEQLAKIKKSFDSLKNDVNQQEEAYSNIIANLKKELSLKNLELNKRVKDVEKLKKYENEIASLNKKLKDTEMKIVKKESIPPLTQSKKLVQVDSIECDDMNSGNFKISSTCKVKVDKFLGKYSDEDFFEIIPIVGTGGFASLNLIKRKSKLGIEDAEIERLTGLANLGLGKHRAKEAGWLLREKFGDDVKISYTVYNIEAQNKRGFVIRVYK